VVAGQDEHILGLFTVQEKEILVHRVGGAPVPLFADALLRRDRCDVFAQFGVQDIPSDPNVPVERMGLVLNQHRDAAQAGIQTIAEGEVDDAIFPAERDGRLGPMFRQGFEPFSLSSGKHHREDAVHGRIVAGRSTKMKPNSLTSGHERLILPLVNT